MKRNKLASLIGCAFVLGLAVIVIGRTSGESAAQGTIERLEILWPSFAKLPERDRAFLAGLSMTCRLHRQPIQRDAIIECLRTAANDPEVILPVGEEKVEATARLARLLEAVPIHEGAGERRTELSPTISRNVTSLDHYALRRAGLL